MNIILIGTVKLTRHCLNVMIENDFRPVGVVTRSSSSINADYADLSEICTKEDIPYICTDNVNSAEARNWMADFKPYITLCLGWSQLLKAETLSIPEYGTIGYHPALLPKNRGRHPLIWALVLGLEETGSTFFMLDEGADCGDIVAQEKVGINMEDNAESLYEKIEHVAGRQLIQVLNNLQNDKLICTKQDTGQSSAWRKRSKVDGTIDWRMSSAAIHNLVRALYRPYPGASITFNGEEHKIWRTEIYEDIVEKNIEPGKVLASKDRRLLVKTYDGAIYLTEHTIAAVPKTGEYL